MKTEVTKLTNQLKQMEANRAVETNSKKQTVLWNQIEGTEKKSVKLIEIYLIWKIPY